MAPPFSSISSFLRGGRDRMTAGGLRTLLNMKLERYAHIDKLELDSGSKTLRVTLRLRGEEDNPLLLTIDGYELLDRAGGTTLKIHKASCERPWIQHLLEDFLLGRELPVPDKAAGIVRAVL